MTDDKTPISVAWMFRQPKRARVFRRKIARLIVAKELERIVKASEVSDDRNELGRT